MNYHTSTAEQLLSVAVLGFLVLTAVISIGSYQRRTARAAPGSGSLLLGPAVRGWYMETLQPLEDLCVRFGILPAYLSFAQLGGSVIVAYCYASGLLFSGGWLLLVTGTLDIIDGRVARRTNSGSRRGAFLDSVIDRYADSLGYLGLAVFFRDSWVLWVVLFALLGGLMVSYTRARAEGLGAECKVGLLQRPERYVILGFGTIFGSLVEHLTAPWRHEPRYDVVILALILLAILANVSAVQRVLHVWRVLGESRD